jgi:hypothetical protein
MNLKLKLLNGIIYLTGILLLGNFYIAQYYQEIQKPFSHPLLIFLIGFVVIILGCYFLRPRLKLRCVDTSVYGYMEHERYLQNMEALVEAYKLSAHKETQSTLMTLMNFVSEEQTRISKNKGVRREINWPFSFQHISKGSRKISPEGYSNSFLR